MNEAVLDDDLRRISAGIIAIDGHLGAGKTSLANRLGRRHGLPVVHVDDYLQRGRRRYVAALRLADLADAIGRHGGRLIVEGVCLLDVLARLGAKPALHVFLHLDDAAARAAASPVTAEVADYLTRTGACARAHRVLTMRPCSPTNRYDVEIAWLNLRTVLCCALAMGGIAALLVGALLLATDADTPPRTLLVVAGVPLTLAGLGTAVLACAPLWALLAFAARPALPRPAPTLAREPAIVEPLRFEDDPDDLQPARLDLQSATLRMTDTAVTRSAVTMPPERA